MIDSGSHSSSSTLASFATASLQTSAISSFLNAPLSPEANRRRTPNDVSFSKLYSQSASFALFDLPVWPISPCTSPEFKPQPRSMNFGRGFGGAAF